MLLRLGSTIGPACLRARGQLLRCLLALLVLRHALVELVMLQQLACAHAGNPEGKPRLSLTHKSNIYIARSLSHTCNTAYCKISCVLRATSKIPHILRVARRGILVRSGGLAFRRSRVTCYRKPSVQYIYIYIMQLLDFFIRC